MESHLPFSASRPLALRFISGKYQGGEFPLKMNRQVTIAQAIQELIRKDYVRSG